jgi:hypothetical protein
MQSYVLLVVVAGVLALPGVAAALVAFPPGEVSIVTRSAAAFGLGYAAAGGCAFTLAAAHAFRLSLFIALWLAVSALLWTLAIKRTSFRDHAHALADDIDKNRLPLLLGALAIAALLVLHLKFLHVLGAPHYVYYLGGIEIANSGGVPSSTLEFGQAWPPATDKAFLDSFTGVLVLLDRNVAIGPGVLLWISLLGAALGLWATAWELGLRRTGALLPLLVLSNQVIFNTAGVHGHGQITQRRAPPVSTDFTEYHAADFGRAMAFCALALGIYAIRQRRWPPAVIAGVVRAAASGTHLVPVLVVVIALFFVALAELLREGDNRARLLVVRQGAVLAGVSAVLGILIRVFAGGSFGLGGASNPSGYAAIHTRFDPTYYLFTGKFLPRGPAAGHWYVPPVRVVADIMAGGGILWPPWALLLLLAGLLLVAILLFLLVRTELRTIGVIAVGTLAGLIAVALAFSYHYSIYVDGTFGVRRLKDYTSLPLVLLALGVLEALLLYLASRRPRLSVAVGVAVVVAVSAWLLPVSAASKQLGRVSHERTVVVDWLRAHTPCNARLLVDQRTEGALTALTGRFALLEGMGPFLRVDKLPYVTNLFLGARQFFTSPLSHQAFLRQHGISYVVVARQGELLGYNGPTGRANTHALSAAPFLHRVMANRSVVVYQVQGAQPLPVSPLLKGPYLHCDTAPVHF